MNLDDTSCCGLKEIDWLSTDPKLDVLEVCEERFDEGDKFAFVLFTDISTSDYGRNLSSYISRRGLGRIVKTKSKKNHNSGNMLKVYVWEISTGNLKSWYLKNKYQ